VSIEAIAWALNTAPIPTHRRDASTLAAVLIGLANHADPDGHNAFPAVARLVRYTRLSERTVRTALHTLEQLGLITPSDPDILAAHIRRADRRPNGWDLALTAQPTPTPKSAATETATGPVAHSTVHNGNDEVQPPHPAHLDEVQTQPHRVQTTTPRGATTAPEPSKNHHLNHPARAPARAPARDPRPAVPAPPPSALPPACGQCDARPGDPISARIEWLDTDRQHSRPCPRCHPTAVARQATRHAAPADADTPPRLAADVDGAGAGAGAGAGEHAATTSTRSRRQPGPRISDANTTRTPAHASAHRGDNQ
jgi:hypothetical protein